MKILCRYNLDCGRMGECDGLFVTTEDDLAAAMSKPVYLGEVLGKHSEIFHVLTEEHVEIVSREQDKIEWLLEVTGGWPTISGYNPLEYIEQEDDSDD